MQSSLRQVLLFITAILPRDANANAVLAAEIEPVCLSVRPSVCQRYAL